MWIVLLFMLSIVLSVGYSVGFWFLICCVNSRCVVMIFGLLIIFLFRLGCCVVDVEILGL